MNKMAAAFNTTVSSLEDELMQLILDGQIQARIDSHNKVVCYHSFHFFVAFFKLSDLKFILQIHRFSMLKI